MNAQPSENQLVFTQGQQSIEVHLHGQTLWLTQLQMAQVFGTTPENVLMHLKNIFAEAELDVAATTKDFLAVRQEGKRQVKRRLKHYNLDAIISVGYRISSVRATQIASRAAHLLYFIIKNHPLVDGNKRTQTKRPDGRFGRALFVVIR